MDVEVFSSRQRRKALEFLIRSSLHLGVSPIVKYTSLSLFAERFLPSLNNNKFIVENNRTTTNWLFFLQQPLRECNIQLFALISIWISTKIHNTCPVSVMRLKSLGDKAIRDQHFTKRDFIEAEVVFLKVTFYVIQVGFQIFIFYIQGAGTFQVIAFEIGASSITFVFLEQYLNQFRQVARVGELVDFDACMDIMDLLYETEEMSRLYDSPRYLAAAILVVSYIITIPKQQWEFPLLPWVKFVTSYEVNDIWKLVRYILGHIVKQPWKEG